ATGVGTRNDMATAAPISEQQPLGCSEPRIIRRQRCSWSRHIGAHFPGAKGMGTYCTAKRRMSKFNFTTLRRQQFRRYFQPSRVLLAVVPAPTKSGVNVITLCFNMYCSYKPSMM